MEIPILYEDENYVALNKPAGIKIHPDKNTEEYTVVDWVKAHFPTLESVGGVFDFGDEKTISRYGIVHRLDKETSGIILIAKNQDAFEYLQGQIRARKVLKTYHVFVNGRMKDERGVIDKPIGRSSGAVLRWSAGRGVRGSLRDAITQYRVLGYKDGVSFIEVMPKTGRTHQIRVHFKAIQHPVVADSLYAPAFPPKLGFKRTALHAMRFSFKGKDGKDVVVVAPYPEDFEKAVKEVETLEE